MKENHRININTAHFLIIIGYFNTAEVSVAFFFCPRVGGSYGQADRVAV